MEPEPSQEMQEIFFDSAAEISKSSPGHIYSPLFLSDEGEAFVAENISIDKSRASEGIDYAKLSRYSGDSLCNFFLKETSFADCEVSERPQQEKSSDSLSSHEAFYESCDPFFIGNSPCTQDHDLGNLSCDSSLSDDRATEKSTCSDNMDRTFASASSIMYDHDDLGCNDLENYDDLDAYRNCNPDLISSHKDSIRRINEERHIPEDTLVPGDMTDLSHLETLCSEEPGINVKSKSKISFLQKKALDSIFAVTDRPSRGLVHHIATELCLHHITVKNFFSNGRRRLRRAAARLNDPERTRRENQKRKEKRRQASLVSTGTGIQKSCESPTQVNLPFHDSTFRDSGSVQLAKDQQEISPGKRALMEKLAVKVQKSVQQKNMQVFAKDSGSLSPPYSSGPRGVASIQLDNCPSYKSSVTSAIGVSSALPANYIFVPQATSSPCRDLIREINAPSSTNALHSKKETCIHPTKNSQTLRMHSEYDCDDYSDYNSYSQIPRLIEAKFFQLV